MNVIVRCPSIDEEACGNTERRWNHQRQPILGLHLLSLRFSQQDTIRYASEQRVANQESAGNAKIGQANMTDREVVYVAKHPRDRHEEQELISKYHGNEDGQEEDDG